MSVEELKAAGNRAIADKKYDEAIDAFSKAIELDAGNHVLYSNRSAAYASKKDWDNALQDAIKTTQIKPDWPRGWGRKGAALHGKTDLAGAKYAYEEGLKLEPNNAGLKSGLESVIRAEQTSYGPGPSGGLGAFFSDPRLLQKLAADPKTSAYLSDPAFMSKMLAVQKDPSALSQNDMTDPRFLEVLRVAVGVADTEWSGASASTNWTNGNGDVEMPDVAQTESAAGKPESKDPPMKQPPPETEPEREPEDEEALAKKKAKEQADKEKALGTESYKKRNFDEAIMHYQSAWDLHKDITYLNNLGAAYFEKGDYQACIETCTKAIEEGRIIYADFKTIAKSYARIGSAYEKMGDLGAAVDHYKKSLTEHRTPEVNNKLRTAERAKIEAAKKAYIDPQKAEEAREEGNKKFKELDFPGAVAAYTEMIKRAPDDARGYSNRAAAFVKLFEFPSALEDCNLAIKKDAKFVRAYIRKAQVYFGMREYSKCLDACNEAARIDSEHHSNANRAEIEQQQNKALQAMYAARENETEDQTRERLAKDPEIMAIMQDPVMQTILQQAQSDPAALQEHLKNPAVRSNIQKLVAAGVIQMGRR